MWLVQYIIKVVAINVGACRRKGLNIVYVCTALASTGCWHIIFDDRIYSTGLVLRLRIRNSLSRAVDFAPCCKCKNVLTKTNAGHASRPPYYQWQSWYFQSEGEKWFLLALYNGNTPLFFPDIRERELHRTWLFGFLKRESCYFRLPFTSNSANIVIMWM